MICFYFDFDLNVTLLIKLIGFGCVLIRVELGGDGGFENLVKHKQCVTAVALSEDDLKGFSASKDGGIVQWDVESGKCERYKWPSDSVLKSHGLKAPQGSAKKQSRQVLTLAASSDGRYLATGGLDRHIHIWDTRTREHLQVLASSFCEILK
jgi:ribosomal RNA-processing protein 9